MPCRPVPVHAKGTAPLKELVPMLRAGSHVLSQVVLAASRRLLSMDIGDVFGSRRMSVVNGEDPRLSADSLGVDLRSAGGPSPAIQCGGRGQVAPGGR